MVGIVAYIYEGHVQNELSISLNETFIQGYNADPEVTKAVDKLQNEVSNFHIILINAHIILKIRILTNSGLQFCSTNAAAPCGLRTGAFRGG